MSMAWPKIIRDPVHNIIPFEDSKFDRLLLNLINCKEFQRLRRIRQLGLSEYVFPGATHTRFSHSIGALQVVKKMLQRIEKLCMIEEETRMVVLATVLLHDIGHGPFSHAFEKISGIKHEVMTQAIIRDDSTEVNAALRDVDAKLPDMIDAFLYLDADSRKSSIPIFFTHLVKSQLDADRFDYLLRDNLATGADYGKFDLPWLIEHLCVDQVKNRIYLDKKSLFAVEVYIYARFHMYQSVYFHKTTRAAEVMLRLLFQRYKELLAKEDSPARKAAVVAGAPNTLVEAFSNPAMSLNNYLALDDVELTHFFRLCSTSSDRVLSVLGRGLLERRLYKTIDMTEKKPLERDDFVLRARDAIRENWDPPEYAFLGDSPSDTPYEGYNPDAEEPPTVLWVENSGGKRVELSTLSKPIQALMHEYYSVRYYFPPELREQVRGLL